MPNPTSDPAMTTAPDTLAGRLAMAMDYLKTKTERPSSVNKAALARACNVSAPSVHAWFSGETKTIDGERLLKAASYFGVSPAWLSFGDGDMTGGAPLSLSRAPGDATGLIRELRDLLATQTPARREAIGVLMAKMVADPQHVWVSPIGALFEQKNGRA